jgi:hypothetical protein
MLPISASYPSHFVDHANHSPQELEPLGILYNGHAGLGANLVDVRQLSSSKNEVSIETLEARREGNEVVTDNKDPEDAARAQVAVSACLPEVDDEVLVAFRQGDARHPYLIASLWNSGDKPPGTLR